MEEIGSCVVQSVGHLLAQFFSCLAYFFGHFLSMGIFQFLGLVVVRSHLQKPAALNL